MKILYDYQAFAMQRFGGVSNCFVRLIENMPDEAQCEIALSECNNTHLRQSRLKQVAPATTDVDNFISQRYFFGRRTLFNLYSQLLPARTSLGRNRQVAVEALQRGDYDVFHPTFFDTYFLPYLQGRPFVLTVHDMTPEVFHWRMDQQMMQKRELAMKATHIVAVSEQTKHDLMEILKVPEEKITVVYHGVQEQAPVSDAEPLVPGRYLFYVGQRKEAYKNFLPMLKALMPVLRHHTELEVVCTGPDFTRAEQQFFRQHGIADRMIHLRPDDEGMRNLYRHALCFVYPSLYEGFGIPILEAWQAGCPVLLNRKSCFPEIAQEAAIYFHLDDASTNLPQVMERFLSLSSAERKALTDRQTLRLQQFSWKRSAEQLYQVYRRIATHA